MVIALVAGLAHRQFVHAHVVPVAEALGPGEGEGGGPFAEDGVHEVYSVTGDTDLIVMVRVSQHDELADVIANHISKVDGVLETRTYIAFQSYSRQDLDDAFDIGFGEVD